MAIRTLLIVAFLATPLAASAASFDLAKLAGTTAKVVQTVDLADSTFQSGWWDWWRNWRRPSPKPKKNGGPVPAVPEPTAALLFGLGAVAMGVGLRKRR